MKFNFFPSKAIVVSIGLVCFAAVNIVFADIHSKDAERFQYDREGEIDNIIETYYKANNLPGISVAIIRDGRMIYRKGFGWADIEEKRPATAETIYNTGSVAKPIGATLAVKLEQDGRLRDGTTFTLDLDRPTSTYLTDVRNAKRPGTVSLPAFHTHTVDQLLSHTGCVADYPDKTIPGIANQTTHYPTAISAVQSIWNIGLVTKMSDAGLPENASNDDPCIMGKTWSYSTPAFTFVAAVLESATGRAIHRLLREEIFTPHGLSSMRIKYASSTLPPDDNRASLYDDDNKRVSPVNNSWRALGGGMETNVVDLAHFGWKVLGGEILSPEARDNRLWRRVDTINSSPGYALGWGVTEDAGSRRIAEHPGMSTGGRALLWIYRDHGLIIAVLSNRRNHPVDDVVVLAGRIGDEIFKIL